MDSLFIKPYEYLQNNLVDTWESPLIVFFVIWVVSLLLYVLLKKKFLYLITRSSHPLLSHIKRDTLTVRLLDLFATLFFWVVNIFFFIVVFNAFSIKDSALWQSIAYTLIPNLMMSSLILIVGIAFIRSIVTVLRQTKRLLGVQLSQSLINMVQVLSYIFLGVLTLDQLGIEIHFLTHTLLITLGCIGLTFSLAFGLGAKEPISRILCHYFVQKELKIGDWIEASAAAGHIVAMTPFGIHVKGEDGVYFVPAQQLQEKGFKVIK